MTRATRLGSASVTVTTAAVPACGRFRAGWPPPWSTLGRSAFDRSAAHDECPRGNNNDGLAVHCHTRPRQHTHTHIHTAQLAVRGHCAPGRAGLTRPSSLSQRVLRRVLYSLDYAWWEESQHELVSVSTRRAAAECALGVGSVARAGSTSYACNERAANTATPHSANCTGRLRGEAETRWRAADARATAP